MGALPKDASYSDKILSHLLGCIFSTAEQNSASLTIWAVLGMAGGLMRGHNVYQWHQCRRSRLYINCAKLMAGKRGDEEQNIREFQMRNFYLINNAVFFTIQIYQTSHLLVVLLSLLEPEDVE